MLDCKSMTISMDANSKNLGDFAMDFDLIDPTVYFQLIGSVMYLKNTVSYICFVVNTLS